MRPFLIYPLILPFIESLLKELGYKKARLAPELLCFSSLMFAPVTEYIQYTGFAKTCQEKALSMNLDPTWKHVTMPKMKAAAKTLAKKTIDAKSLFQEVPCALCGSNSYTVIRPGRFPAKLSDDFLKKVYRSSSDAELFEQVVECKKCGLVYLNPRLKPELIIDSYAEGEDRSFIAQDPMRVRTFTKAIRQLASEQSIPLTKRTKLLDIGCAGGAFLQAARNLGLTTVGIEPNKWMCEYARTTHGLDARPGVLADHKFPAKSFDVVTLWDVIEHVPDPNAELAEIYRILKPGGTLVINYPDYQSLPAKTLGKKWPFWLSVHLTYFAPATIRQQLKKAGFKVMSLAPHWQTLELGYAFKRATPYFKLFGSIRRLVESVGLGHAPLTYWMGQTKVVAKKVR